MSISSITDLVDTLRQGQLLLPGQLEELAELRRRFKDPRELAKELVRKGWVTTFQINQVFQGRGLRLVLGSYVILERLGEGGMGQVFKARHLRMDRVVALKVIRKEKLSNPEAVKRFHREMQAVGQLSHPNVVLAFDADQAAGTHFYAMEYVEGIDLDRRLRESGPLPIVDACEYLRQAALGLQHAHERGLVHRDIKPGNLMVTTAPARDGKGPETVVKLLDLGLARIHPPDDPAASALTQEGLVMGTVDYLAPEQAINSHLVDIRADIYSLGCTFYHLLTGQVPYPGGSAMERLLRHREQEPTPAEKLRPDLPPTVAAMVRRLMAKRPEDRYQTPAEVAAECTVVLDPAAQAQFNAAAINSSPAPIPASITSMDAQNAWAEMTASPSLPTETVLHAPRSSSPWRRRAVYLGLGGAALLLGLCLLSPLINGKKQFQEGDKAVEPDGVVTNSAMVTLKGILDRFENPATDSEDVRLALLDFRVQYAGTDQARIANEKLGLLPSPLDKLERNPRFSQGMGSRFGGELFVHLFGKLGTRSDPPCWSVAFSPDCRTIAAAGEEQIIRLWSGSSGEARPELSGHKGSVRAIAFSPDSKTLASASNDRTIRLWDLTKFPVTAMVLEHEPISTVLLFSPDGHTLASSCMDGKVYLWDVSSGKQRSVLDGHTGPVRSLAFSPDNKTLASGGVDLTVCVWDTTQPKPEPIIKERLKKWIGALAFTPNGTSLLCGDGGDCDLYLCDLGQNEFRSRLPFKAKRGGSAIQGAAITPDGKFILSVDRDGRIQQRLTATAETHREWIVPAQVNGLALSSDGRHLATANNNGTVALYRLGPPLRK